MKKSWGTRLRSIDGDMWGGPVVSLILAGFLIVLRKGGVTIAAPPTVLVIAVVFSAFRGGVRSGLASVVIVCGFLAYFLGNPETSLGHYSDENLGRLVSWWVAMPVIAIVVGRLRQSSEARFLALANGTFEGISIQERGVILECNRNLAQMLGSTVGGVVGTKATDYVSFSSVALVAERIRSGSEEAYEAILRRKDGSEFPAEIRGRHCDFRGRTVRISAIRDLTIQKGIERELHQARLLEEADKVFSQRIAELVPNNIYIFDVRNGANVFSNRDVAASLGYLPDDVKAVGDRFLSTIVHPEDLPRVLARRAELERRRDGEVVEFISRVRHSSGDWRWFLNREAVFKRGVEGTPLQLIGISQDITEIQSKNDALQESEARFRDLVNLVPIGIFKADIEGRIVYASDRVCRLTGLTPYELQGDWSGVLHPDDREHVVREYAAAVRERRTYDLEHRFQRKDGTVIWTHCQFEPYRGPDGVVTGYLGVVHDISERKHNEDMTRQVEVLQRSEETFRELAEAIPQIVWTARPDGEVDYFNQRWSEYTGLKQGVHAAESWAHLIHPEDIRATTESYRDSISLGVQYESEHRFKRASDGEYRWHLNRAAPVLDSAGTIIKWFGTSTDIHDRKEAERLARSEQSAREASRLKSEFLANMSHEIRTPINGVMGMSEFLLDTPLSPDQRDYAQTIRRSADTLLTLVNDVLDFSKIEAGKLEIETVEFDLDELIRDTGKLFVHAATQKGVFWSVEAFTGLKRLVKGDSGRLRQVVANLVSNAIKFTSTGEVTLKVRLESQAASGVVARFEIKDTGIGIPEETRRKLFQPFTQADSSTTRKFGGTGLGLSICKHLVKLMQGQIGISSAAVQGSVFWFTIPLELGADCVPANEAPSSPPIVLAERSALILVAEDNAINQKVAIKLLQKLGYRAHAVADGNEAINALREMPYDLILMDCQMPELDGYEATRLIRSSKTLPNPGIPIVALTANAVTGDREKCLAAGMDDYVTKPIKSHELAKTIAKHLRKRVTSLNPLVLKELRDMGGEDTDLLGELATLYCATAPQQRIKIEEAWGAGDATRVASEAHSLKSSAAKLGATELAQLLGEVESIAISGGLNEAKDIRARLCEELERVWVEVDALRARKAA